MRASLSVAGRLVVLAGLFALIACRTEPASSPRPRRSPQTTAGTTLPGGSAAEPERDRSRWASAADAAVPPARTPAQVCQVDVGCSFEPAPVPTCPTGLASQSVDSVLAHPDAWLGQDVVLRGQLAPLASMAPVLQDTKAAWCRVPPYRLGVTTETPQRAPLGIALSDAVRSSAFECVGDRSLQCCPFPTYTGARR